MFQSVPANIPIQLNVTIFSLEGSVGPDNPKRKITPQTNRATDSIETLVTIWKCLPLWLSHNRPKNSGFFHLDEPLYHPWVSARVA